MIDDIDSCMCSNCVFKSIPVSNLNKKELEQLCCNSVDINFQNGEKIIKQGSFTTNIVYIREGLVKIHMEEPLKKEEILKLSKAPEFIGLPANFADRVYQFSATALTEVKACFIDINIFNGFVSKNGAFAQELLKYLGSDILNYFKRCAHKVQKQLHGNLAETLIYFSEQIFNSQSFLLPLNRNELASYVGSTRESVTRILKEFIQDNLIKMDNKKITILNMELLKKISSSG